MVVTAPELSSEKDVSPFDCNAFLLPRHCQSFTNGRLGPIYLCCVEMPPAELRMHDSNNTITTLEFILNGLLELCLHFATMENNKPGFLFAGEMAGEEQFKCKNLSRPSSAVLEHGFHQL